MNSAESAPSSFWPAGVARRIDPLPPTLNEMLRRTVAYRPDHTALVYYGREISYANLLANVERLAAYLQFRCGVRAGDRVILNMQNSPQFVVAYHAILRAGAVVVPVNPMNVVDELTFLCADSGATVALIGAELLRLFTELVRGPLRYIIVAGYSDEVPNPAQFHLPLVIAESTLPACLPTGFVSWAQALSETRLPTPDLAVAEDLCVMPYTSGTTGRPKACMHSHYGAVFSTFANARWLGFDDETVVTGFMPFFHVAGMQVSMNAGLACGATIVIMSRWDRDLISPLFLRYGVTMWSGTTTMVVDVLSAPDFDSSAFSKLRTIAGGGAAMPAAVANELQRRWGLHYVEGYGLTETISTTHLNPPDRPKPQCLGMPIHETVSRIIDPETLEEVPSGEVGEIIVAGPQVMRGYWMRPDANKAVFVERDGLSFLRTGDLGRMDEEGYFYIVDRLKRMINVSGYKVWPAECEATLYAHPSIQECCVFSGPDELRGETVSVAIVLRPGEALTAEALIGWARAHMATYKVPRRVIFVEALPRSGSNKIDWRRLQNEEWARANRHDGRSAPQLQSL